MPIEIARKVVINPRNYPRVLVELAENAFRIEIEDKVVAVAEVARCEEWSV